MGQRHQIFIVAKVITQDLVTRYRCVGAYHHQWCYGRLPLRGARRFLDLLKQKDNANIVKAELATLNRLRTYGTDVPPDSFVYAPVPYALFLVAQAFCVDLDTSLPPGSEPNAPPLPPYSSGVSFTNGILNATMGSSHGDNNDGITVFDITTPDEPSYCHVSVGGLESEEDVESWVPLTAAQYCRAYYPDHADSQHPDEQEKDVRLVIESLREERLITLDVLAETWPDEYKVPKVPSKAAVSIDTQPNDAFPTLVELTLGPAIEHGLKTGDLDPLEDLVWHPGKGSAYPRYSAASEPVSRLWTLSSDDPRSTRDENYVANESRLGSLDKPSYPTRFLFIGFDYAPALTGLPIFSPSAVVQSLKDVLSILAGQNPHFKMTGMVSHSAFASTRSAGVPWSQRRVPCIPAATLPTESRSGRTWVFVLQWDMFGKGKYGFASRDWVEGGKPTPYDLRGFLEAMQQEGRESVPESDVGELEEILTRLDQRVERMTQQKGEDFFRSMGM
ncbi:hypothetical protein HMN09_00528100 [Mycena chlorophos]|uniref:Uncharacterized protein n=1 Tax=Mycena chlorophos TaxID=658473 RepID=A0A8H6WDD4_MYCCL|nr:hypothetical protein HMN09_00528100 [Mycena chlorophos]